MWTILHDHKFSFCLSRGSLFVHLKFKWNINTNTFLSLWTWSKNKEKYKPGNEIEYKPICNPKSPI